MSLSEKLRKLNERTLAGWGANPDLVQKDAREEEVLVSGGYHDRQILELVQNAADAAHDRRQARIELRLTERHLYAANTGVPVSEEGLRALILGGVSPKGGEEIGRFGLGFRSLLRLGGRVDMLSAGLACRFDPAWCAAEARKAAGLGDDAEAPGMRLAQELDLPSEMGADATLTELLGWADTIVRAELAAEDAAAAMDRELRAFPAEFLLFPKANLRLHIRLAKDEERHLHRSGRKELPILWDGKKKAQWRLFSERVRIDDHDAVRDAGRLHARGEVTICWAVPMGGGDPRAGQLWSAFPTRTPSVVSGIIDARFKLNSDRTALTGEAWNAALLRAAARLVARSLPALSTADDPGRALAALPRQLERKDEPAVPLFDELWRALPEVAFVPSATGKLHRPAELLRPPIDRQDLHERWSGIAAERAIADQLVHHTCLASKERQSRLDHLSQRLAKDSRGGDYQRRWLTNSFERRCYGEPALRRLARGDWFEAIASDDTAVAREVILLAADFAKDEWISLRGLKIIPTQDGQLSSAEHVVFPETARGTGVTVLHADLAADAEVREVLVNVFKIESTDEAGWRRALEKASQTRDEETVWDQLRQAPEAVREEFLRDNRGRLKVRTCDGQWRPPSDTLLIGEMIRADEATQNAAVAIDGNFASTYRVILHAIGVGTAPPEGETESPPKEAEDAAVERYRKVMLSSRSARQGTLRYVHGVACLAGAHLLSKLQGRARARLTALLLKRLANHPKQSVRVGGRGVQATEDRYPAIDAPDPTAWLLWKYGWVEIGGKIVCLAACSELRRQLAKDELQVVAALLPDDRAIRERWPEGWPEFTSPVDPVWEALLASRRTRDHAELRPLWHVAARHGFVPNTIPDPHGDGEVPLRGVLVATDEADHALADEAGEPCALLDEATAARWCEHGAKGVRERIRLTAVGKRSTPTPATEDMAGLADFLSAPAPLVQYVGRIERRLGKARTPAALLVDNGVLVVSKAWSAQVSRAEALRQKLAALAELTTLTHPWAEVLEELDLSATQRQRAEVAAEPDLPARLLRAAGGREALVASLPDPARRTVADDLEDARIAQLCLDVHGPGALRVLQGALGAQGLRPPKRWGTDEARRFVAALGFPMAFAGAGNPRLDAEILVMGPKPLPRLHDYQQDALAALMDLVGLDADRRRAVLSLPTGAGKTRVAVEAVVRSILRREAYRRLVIWVAQTEELAEQAVEAFRQVWAVEGDPDAELRIVRFWGGQRTPPEADPSPPTVVVTLIQTLDKRLSQEDASWLRAASMLVIDESHHAIAPTYTQLLRELGIEVGPRPATSRKVEAPEPVLLGLTATPFRSAGDDETRRLAQRFDARVVPADQEGLYARLRQQEVLSAIEMKPLPIDRPFVLTPQELQHLEQFEELPETALTRLARNEDRNAVILESAVAAAERPTLLFANSVDHAIELAARLSLRGVRARPVSGNTDRSARRDSIEAFKRDEVRVLCNAQVLATGFDAPKVETILIARPVFSPVRFMQMVGRGLRGPKNGGTETCRVLTVRDNIVGYDKFDPVRWWRHHYN